MIVTSGMLFLYIFAGMLAMNTGIWVSRYPFLSLTADPYFVMLSFLVGFDVCLGTGAIIMLYTMLGIDTTRDQISTLAAFIGFGFGAGVIRITLPTILQIVTTI